MEPVHKPKPLLARMFCNLQKKHRGSIADILALQQAWLTQVLLLSSGHLGGFQKSDFKVKIVGLEWF